MGSAIPFESLIEGSMMENTRALKLMKALRLARSLKLLKLYQNEKYQELLERSLDSFGEELGWKAMQIRFIGRYLWKGFLVGCLLLVEIHLMTCLTLGLSDYLEA